MAAALIGRFKPVALPTPTAITQMAEPEALIA
jgi:hypothetical protein